MTIDKLYYNIQKSNWYKTKHPECNLSEGIFGEYYKLEISDDFGYKCIITKGVFSSFLLKFIVDKNITEVAIKSENESFITMKVLELLFINYNHKIID